MRSRALQTPQGELLDKVPYSHRPRAWVYPALCRLIWRLKEVRIGAASGAADYAPANLLGALVWMTGSFSTGRPSNISGVQTEVLERKLPWLKYKEQKDNYGQVRF